MKVINSQEAQLMIKLFRTLAPKKQTRCLSDHEHRKHRACLNMNIIFNQNNRAYYIVLKRN